MCNHPPIRAIDAIARMMGRTLALVGIAAALIMPGMQVAKAQSKWAQISGQARDVAIADDGTVWTIGSNATGSDYGIFMLGPRSNSFEPVPGAAVRIAISGQTPWAVNSHGQVLQFDGQAWRQIPGPKAIDIGASAAGVWITAEPKRSKDYAIYQRTQTGWQGVKGAARRIDVDDSGKPWVAKANGRLFAFVDHKWVRFKSEVPAADLSVDKFGEPWVVGKSGALWHYNGGTRKWVQQGSAATAVAQRRDQSWYVSANEEVFHDTASGPPRGSVVVEVQKPSVHVPDPAAPQEKNIESSTITLEGSSITITTDEATQSGDQDKPSLLGDAITTFEPGFENGTLSLSGGPTLNLKLSDETLLTIQQGHYGPDWAKTTAAAQGAENFREPGLGAFLAGGGFPALELIYSRPDLIASYLQERFKKDNPFGQKNSPFGNIVDLSKIYVTKQFQTICEHPTDHPAIKGMMYMMLIDAIGKPVSKRTKDETFLVNNFARYMQRRKLFIAERAFWLDQEWRFGESEKAKNRIRTVEMFKIPKPPPKAVLDKIAEAAALTTAGVAVLVGAGVAMTAFVSGAPLFAAIAPFSVPFSVAVGTGVTSAGAAFSSIALAAAGPAAIVLGGIAVVVAASIQVDEAEKYEKALAKSLDDGRKPVVLEQLAQSEAGLVQIAYFWSMATSELGPITFPGNPAGACAETEPDLSKVPAGVADRAPTASGKSREILEASGISYKLFDLSGFGEQAWKAQAVARLNCFDPEKISKSIATGRPSCRQLVRREKPIVFDSVEPEKAPIPEVSWTRTKGYARLPANAVTGGSRNTGEELIVCRAEMGDGVHPGKVWRGKCNVGWGGKEVAKNTFDVLVADSGSTVWMLHLLTQPIPKNAVVAGKLRNGRPLAVCRAKMRDGTHPGKIWDGKCSVGWGGKEVVMPVYEVLVRTGG